MDAPDRGRPDASPRLAAVKAVHTVVWAAVEACVVVVLVEGIRRPGGRVAATAGAVVGVETTVFLALGGRCPLTGVARRLGNPEGAGDIYLPGVVARNLAMAHVPLVALALRLHLPAVLTRRDAPAVTRPGRR